MPKAKRFRRAKPVKFNWQLILILFALAFLTISIISLNNKISLDTSAKSIMPTIRDEIRICFTSCREKFTNFKNQGLCIAACNKFKPSNYPTIGPTTTIRFPTQSP